MYKYVLTKTNNQTFCNRIKLIKKRNAIYYEIILYIYLVNKLNNNP